MLEFANPKEFLDQLLEGRDPEQEDLVKLAKLGHESVNHDFKAGEKLKERGTRFSRFMEKFVTGFANADGGVLIFGVDEDENNNFTVSGCESPPKDYKSKLGRGLSRVRGSLLPPPRLFEVSLDNGKPVYLVAVERAPNLVTLPSGDPLAYLRVGSDTYPMDSYLYHDLVLGRRNHPAIEVLEPTLKITLPPRPNPRTFADVNPGTATRLSFELGLTVVNDSYQTHEFFLEAAIPMVPGAGYPNATGSLLKQIQADGARIGFLRARDSAKIHPFDQAGMHLPVFTQSIELLATMRAAVAIRAAGHPPCWYQLILDPALHLSYTPLNPAIVLETDQPVIAVPDVTRTHSRPIVSWTRPTIESD